MAQSNLSQEEKDRHYCKSLATDRNCSERWASSPILQWLSPTSPSQPALFPSFILAWRQAVRHFSGHGLSSPLDNSWSH